MKICMIKYSFYEMDPRVRREAESLANRGDNVDVICLRGEGTEKHDCVSGVDVYRIQRRFSEKRPIDYIQNILCFFFLSAFRVTGLFLKKRYDLVHIISYPDFEVFAALIPKLFGAKIVLNIHALNPEFYARKFGLHDKHIMVRFLKRIEKISSGFADHIITVTEIYKDTLVGRSIPESKCTVLLSVPDSKTFTPVTHKNKLKTITVMCFGKLLEHYGIDLLIRAMDIVRQHVPSARLEVNAYDGPERDAIMKLTEELKLKEFVRFNITKLRPLDKYSEMMHEADIGIDSRRGGVFMEETLSSVILNFLTVRIPAIVSKTKASQTYFDESIVMFFKPDDYHDLARCIIDLCNNPRKREELITNGDRFIKYHSWERYRNIYYELLDNLCKS
ncbi:MAG: glycosyltransferase [Desulfobacteraceae bacterium]|nr:glycosyltransferase [Desulfobacteraceae bacterium]